MSGFIKLTLLTLFLVLFAGGIALDAFSQPPDPIFRALISIIP